MSAAPKPNPLLLVYKEIGPGDLLKLQGISNITQSGGGARDLRLPWRTFRPVMHRIFDKDATGRGGREIREATITYVTAGGTATTTLQYWPPTTSRPSEDRVARIHASPALGGRLPQDDKGRVFLLFIRWDNDENRCYYAYEDDLKKPGKWAAEVRQAILECMSDTDTKNLSRSSSNRLSVQGYYDFVSGSQVCHAR